MSTVLDLIQDCFDYDHVPMTKQGVQEMTKATTWMIDILRAFIAVLLRDLLLNWLALAS